MGANMTEHEDMETALPSTVEARVDEPLAPAASPEAEPAGTLADTGQGPDQATDDVAEFAGLQETAEDVGMLEEERRRSVSGAEPPPFEADADGAPETVSNTHVVASSPVLDQPKDEAAPAVPEGSGLKRELDAVKEELEAVKERLGRLEKAPVASLSDVPDGGGDDVPDRSYEQNLEVAVSRARDREAAGLAEDQKALSGHQQDLRHWCAAAASLQLNIQEAIEKAKGVLAEATQAKDALPPLFQENLKGRHQGLELVGKMLTRLPEKVSSLGCEPGAEADLRALAEPEWRQILTGDVSGKKAEAKLRALEAERYQRVTQVRDIADGQRKRLFGFLEKQLLPILDALDEGEKLSKPYRTIADKPGAISPDPAASENLIRWFKTYSLIRADLLAIAANLDIQPMTVSIGEMIDYTRHEPFDVVQDPEQPTEAIKEEVRKGYECRLPGEQAPIVLRAAQVVVVKN